MELGEVEEDYFKEPRVSSSAPPNSLSSPGASMTRSHCASWGCWRVPVMAVTVSDMTEPMYHPRYICIDEFLESLYIRSASIYLTGEMRTMRQKEAKS